MAKKPLKVLIAAAGIEAFILAGALFMIGMHTDFHKNYISREIFESVDYIYRYKALTRERRGEYEEKIVYTKDDIPVWLVDCGDIKVLYRYDADECKASYFMYAQTTDSSYIFGEEGIRIGMDRKAVEKILKKSKKSSPWPHQHLIIDDMEETSYQEQDVYEYFDDIYDYGMGFLYDDNDKVSRIFLYLGL